MELDAKIWPDAQVGDSASFYKVPFTNVIYIEKSDFRLKDSKDYYGLAPAKTILLRYAYPIKCTEVIFGDDNETIVELRAEYDPTKSIKSKGILHWVAEPFSVVDPVKAENPSDLDDWMAYLNPKSKEVIPEGYAVPKLAQAKLDDKFQFERPGYFSVDQDSSPEKIVFNRTVTLRDSYANLKHKYSVQIT